MEADGRWMDLATIYVKLLLCTGINTIAVHVHYDVVI